MNGLFKSQTFGKIPLYIIIAVIIFILIFVVILASIGSNEKTMEKKPYYKKETKLNKKDISLDKSSKKDLNNFGAKGIVISSYAHSKVSDSFVIDIDNVNPNESYIFGGPMQYSSVSVYVKDQNIQDLYTLLNTKVYSGNKGFAICSNINLVNPSYYQIGKKIDLENLRYNFIPFIDYSSIRIVVNNIGYEDFKVYKCTFNYDIPHKKIDKIPKSLSTFGLSEYDIEQACKNIIKTQNMESSENILSRFNLTRTFNKKESTNVWKYNSVGDFVLFYVKGIYNFSIKDSYNNIDIIEKGNKDLENGSLGYFKITDPRLEIINLDENIPSKSFNDDVINLMNAPVSFYKHFMYGKKKEKVDIWNRIQNKIFIYKI